MFNIVYIVYVYIYICIYLYIYIHICDNEFLLTVQFPRLPLPATWLKGNMPSLSLVQISHYFIDRLSAHEYQQLEAIAHGLNGRSVPVASTCSGLATAGHCVKALFQAINQRFNTDVQASCEFAVEIEPWKQQFILDAHGDQIRHLFADVKCVNLSGQRIDREGFASCYEGGVDCESGVTYEYGYKQATIQTQASVTIYENVRDAAHSLTDESGVKQKPAVDIVKEDSQLCFAGYFEQRTGST